MRVSIEVQGRGEDRRRVIHVGGWELIAWSATKDDEPRIRDIELAERLGFDQPRDIRKLIKRTFAESELPYCRATVARQPVGPKGGGERTYQVDEYWLTEAEALKVIARSKTKIAEAILDDMIRVYITARRGLLQPRPPSPTAARLQAVENAVTGIASQVGALTDAVTALTQSVTMFAQAQRPAPVLPPAPLPERAKPRAQPTHLALDTGEMDEFELGFFVISRDGSHCQHELHGTLARAILCISERYDWEATIRLGGFITSGGQKQRFVADTPGPEFMEAAMRHWLWTNRFLLEETARIRSFTQRPEDPRFGTIRLKAAK